MTAAAVIGANFGDEGKGKVVDWLVSSLNAYLVVRFNGGAQAGHTVDDGRRRHVFHHFGSGTLAGRPTFLSRFFVTNPILWKKEWQELRALGVRPVLYVDPECQVTTPYDMLLNQAVERARGRKRHGSCGVGFNETIQRGKAGFPLTVAHLGTGLKEQLVRMVREYVPRRLKEFEDCGLRIWKEDIARLNDLVYAMKFADEVEDFMGCIAVVAWRYVATRQVVFEGAQGLLLDQNSQFFPHVTHSKTGLTNVATLCLETGIRDLDVTYVTRSYMTRHGAGPFPSEDKSLAFEDKTNKQHDWQGWLRFGDLDSVLTSSAISLDLEEARATGLRVRHGLAINCVDQREDKKNMTSLRESVKPEWLFLGRGPTRSDMVQQQKEAA